MRARAREIVRERLDRREGETGGQESEFWLYRNPGCIFKT